MVTKRAERGSAANPLVRRLFSIAEYDGMVTAGILREDEHVELLKGEIVCMAPIGNQHMVCVTDLYEWLVLRLHGQAIVRCQGPIQLPPRSEPEPDLVICHPRPDRYRSGHPGPADILLLIEVSDTSLAYDRDHKLPLYAAAGIPEVWIVDLAGERVHVHRTPRRGRYTHVTMVEREGTLSPAAFPELILSVDDILGPTI